MRIAGWGSLPSPSTQNQALFNRSHRGKRCKECIEPIFHSLKAPLNEAKIGSKTYSSTLLLPIKILAEPSTPGIIVFVDQVPQILFQPESIDRIPLQRGSFSQHLKHGPR